MAIASAVVAVAALLFTVTSFWWLQARRGKLHAYPPNTFSGYLKPDSAAIRLPLSVFNDGAVPIVVTDLRLRLIPSQGKGQLFHFRTFRKSVWTGSDDVEDFAHPWCVPGRTVVSKHIEFASLDGPKELLSGAPVKAIVECLQGHDDGRWVALVVFPLHIEIMAHPSRYITYSNQEHVWPPSLRNKAATAFDKLRTEIESK